MEKKKTKINLTDDPLLNIHMMTNILNNKGREAMSYLMFGYYLGSTQNQPQKKPPIEEGYQNE